MRTDLLEILATHLETVPDEQFDLKVWRSGCGTVACAMGHACDIPEFQKMGLQVNMYGAIKYAGLLDYNAAALLFDITYKLSFGLFSPMSYPLDMRTRLHVIDRIRQTIKETECIRKLNTSHIATS